MPVVFYADITSFLRDPPMSLWLTEPSAFICQSSWLAADWLAVAMSGSLDIPIVQLWFTAKKSLKSKARAAQLAWLSG